jgi:phage FluMu protein Com
MEKEEYIKIELECKRCKTRFEIWISENNYNPGVEENMKKYFYRYCPACKVLEKMKEETSK